MTYLFNSNNNIINEVEIKNDIGNTIPTTIYHQSIAVGNSNPLPVTLGSSNVNIIGNISIPTTVNVASSPENPVHVHLTELGGNGSGSGVILTTFVPIQGNVVATINNTESDPALVKFSDKSNVQLDSNQRLRVSLQGQQWWYTSSVDKDGDLRFVESFTGANANSYFIQNLASVKLTSGTSANGIAIRASRRRHKVRPGVSHQYTSIHNFDGVQANTVTRVGMFTNFNGMFFEVSDDLYVVVRRRLIDGTLVEDKVRRNEFNYDKLDGSGISGFDFTSKTEINITGWVNTSTVNVSNTSVYNVTYTTSAPISSNINLGYKCTVSGVSPSTYNGVATIKKIDNSNNQIVLTYTTNPGTYTSMSSGKLTHTMLHNMYTWWFDFNGGRTGKIRFGINSPEGPVLLHMFDYAGKIGQQYESAPALMDRAEILNTGAVSYLPSLTLAGTTFNIEAEVELNPGFGIATNNTYVPFSKGAYEEHPILGIALRAGEPYQRSDLQLQSIKLIDIANVNQQNSGVYYWKILLNPTIGGYVPNEIYIGKSTRQWNYYSNTTVSGGIPLTSGYFTSVSSEEISTALNFLNLGSNIDYTDSDKLVLVVKQLEDGTSDGHIVATLNFIEAL